LDPIPFPAAVYVRNHGSNMSERPDFYSETVRAARFEIVRKISRTPVSIDRALALEFNLDALMSGNVAGTPVHDVPSLTIAVTTCRRPAGLLRLLDALRPQVEGRRGREIVVVNDGSHDADYEAVVGKFKGLLRYEALPVNLGVGAARNRAAALADGAFVVYVDDDCVPPPFWLDWLAGRLAAQPDLDVLAGTARLLWRSRGFFERVQAHFRMLPRPWVTLQDIIFVTANVAIRRKILERLGGFRPLRIGEDSELAGRIALAGARAAFDEDWFVLHEPEPFRAKLRKYWRYGFTNVALHERTTVPVAFANLLHARRRLHVRNARFNFRRAMAEADGFSVSPASRLAAVLAVTCVQMAYYDGCAAGARSRRARPPA
jgi:glycosyltransferase involved in cell wall biosynthesis